MRTVVNTVLLLLAGRRGCGRAGDVAAGGLTSRADRSADRTARSLGDPLN
jgi:hypothetical protein